MHFEAQRWKVLAKRLQYPCVVLESGEYWDDHGYVTRFTVYFYPREGEELPLGPVKVLQRGAHRTQLPEAFQALDETFCSLGQDMAFYQEVARLGAPMALELLEGLRDIVLRPDIGELFQEEPGLRKSLLRSSSALKAYREAGRLFGKAAPSDQPLSFTLETRLPGFAEDHRVSFELRPRPGGLGRAMALVGRNGTGKTALLGRLAYALSGLEDESTTRLEPRPLLSAIIAISYSAFDTFKRPRRSDLGVSYFYRGLRTSQQTGEDPSERLDPRRSLSEMAEALAWVGKLKRKEKWEQILKEAEVPAELGLQALSYEDVLSHSEWMGPLSSGHKLVVLVLTHLLATLRPNSMVLFDEPELHLHPQILSRLMRALHGLLNEFDSYAIIATHSPMVLQEIPAASIRIVERIGLVPSIRGYPGESFGENLTEIVNTAFQVSEDARNYIRILQELVGQLSDAEISNLFGSRLSLNARMTLRSLLRERKEPEGKND